MQVDQLVSRYLARDLPEQSARQRFFTHSIAPLQLLYQRRRPERSVAYQVVQQNLETWLALRRAGGLDAGAGWVIDQVPAHVERDLRKYLECDTLAHGFARAKFYSWRLGRHGKKAGVCEIYSRYSGRCPRARAYSI